MSYSNNRQQPIFRETVKICQKNREYVPFLGNLHLRNEKKSQSADNKQNFKILVPLRAKHLLAHNNTLILDTLNSLMQSNLQSCSKDLQI